MRSTETVSAVLPTRDRSRLLRRALESVLAQSRPADEIIVVDDGSQDDTAEWLPAEFPQVRYLQQDHAGVSAARNRGVAAATGAWISFLDSDDEWRPNKLARQLDAVTAQPEFSICHTNEIWMRDGRRVNQKNRHRKAGGHIFQRCLPLCAISPSAVMIRRELLESVGGFDEALPVCEDYDLWLRLCAHHPVLYLEEPLVIKYGGHDDQLSRSYWGMDRFRIQALDRILDAELRPEDRSAALEVLLGKIDVYVRGARKRGKHDEAARYQAIRDRRFSKTGVTPPRTARDR